MSDVGRWSDKQKPTKQTVCFLSHLTYLTLLRHFCTLLHFTLTYGDFRVGSPLFSLDFFFMGSHTH
jgi:hypothetical protein